MYAFCSTPLWKAQSGSAATWLAPALIDCDYRLELHSTSYVRIWVEPRFRIMSSSPAHDIGGTDTDSPNSSVHSFYVTELSDTESAVFVGNGGLVDKASAAHHGRVAIEDWSQTGRGVHIDFDDRETVPLTQGTFLYGFS